MILIIVIGLWRDSSYIPVQNRIEEIIIPSYPASQTKGGIGFDFLDPLGSIFDPIVEGITGVIQQAINLFDDFIAYTPNIANPNGQIHGVNGMNIDFNVDKFFNLTTSIAWLLLPLIVVINGTYLIVMSNPNGILVVKQLGKKIVLFAVGIIALRIAFALAIDLTNAINGFVLRGLIGGPSTNLSMNILEALGINSGQPIALPEGTGVFNIFAQIILWGGLFITLLGLLLQFGMRFFDILFHILLYPIILLVSLIPGGEKFFKEYIEQIGKNLFLQPIFLIALAIVIEFIGSQNGAVTKFVMGLISLVFLNFVPTIINRYSGLIWGFGAVEASRIINRRIVQPTNKLLSNSFNREKPIQSPQNFSNANTNINYKTPKSNATRNSTSKTQ